MKIHQRKRERDEKTENGSEKEKSPLKRLKIDKESPQENEPKSSIQGAPDLNADEKVGDDATAISADTSKMENRTDGDDNEDDGDEDIEDEDPEEFFEDEQEVDGADDIPQEVMFNYSHWIFGIVYLISITWPLFIYLFI